MLSPYEIAGLIATAGAGLVAGLCFSFGSFILRAFDSLGAPQAIRAMQAINRSILRSSAMWVWFGTVFVGAGASLLAEARALPVTATVLYAIGAVLITGRGNVPLNEELDRVDPDGPDAEAAWQRYRLRWSRWNLVRTVVCVLASIGFALGV